MKREVRGGGGTHLNNELTAHLPIEDSISHALLFEHSYFEETTAFGLWWGICCVGHNCRSIDSETGRLCF